MSSNRTPRDRKDIGLYQDIVLTFTHGFGCPERRDILSRLLMARKVELSPEMAASVGRCAIAQSDVLAGFAHYLKGLPDVDTPVWIEYGQEDRCRLLQVDRKAEGASVPARIGALVFADPTYDGGIDIFICWHDQNHNLFHSYAVMLWDVPAMCDAAFGSVASFMDRILGRERPTPPIYENVFVSVPPGLAEEMYIWHEMPAVNDPRRAQALERTSRDVMAEHAFLLAYFLMMSTPQASGDGLSAPGRLEVRKNGLEWLPDSFG